MPYTTDWEQPATVATRRKFHVLSETQESEAVSAGGLPLDEDDRPPLLDDLAATDRDTALSGVALDEYDVIWSRASDLWPTQGNEFFIPGLDEDVRSSVTGVYDFDAGAWLNDFILATKAAFIAASPYVDPLSVVIEFEGFDPDLDIGSQIVDNDIVFGVASNRQIKVTQRTDQATEQTDRFDSGTIAATGPHDTTAVMVMDLDESGDGVLGGGNVISTITYDSTDEASDDETGTRGAEPIDAVTLDDTTRWNFGFHKAGDSTHLATVAPPATQGGQNTTTIVIDDELWNEHAVEFQRFTGSSGPEWRTTGIVLKLGPADFLLPGRALDTSFPWGERSLNVEIDGYLHYEHDFTPPRYRIRYEVLQHRLPHLVVFPRDDGYGASSTPSLYPPPKSQQASNSVAGDAYF